MPKFIFILGSTGTGKSTLAEEVKCLVTSQNLGVTILNLDHYYLPKSMRDMSQSQNFDVPSALDEKLVIQHLKTLEKGMAIARPTYDMTSSDRLDGGQVMLQAEDVIIVEGIFAGEYVSKLQKDTGKLKIYVDSPSVLSNYSRKEDRDKVERKKSEAHINAMKKNQIFCLFQYVNPHMSTSDIVVINHWQPTKQKIAMLTKGDETMLCYFLAKPLNKYSC